MLNGSRNDAPASNRARLVAISPNATPPLQERRGGKADSPATSAASSPERMQWFVIPFLTLGSALAGGAAAWLIR